MDVRRSFRHKYCGEYDLPSGKPSGYFRFPITSAEVEELTADISDDELKSSAIWQQCQNNSEVRLWIALRMKYGINYLAPVKWQFWLADYKYDPHRSDEDKEQYDKILFEISSACDNVFEELSSRINDLKNAKEEKDFKKNFDSDLTSPESML